MIDRFVAPAAGALLLLAIAAGCTPDGPSVATSVPASVDALDFSALNGKALRIEGKASGDFSVVPPETEMNLRILGKTIVWGGLERSQCVLHSQSLGRKMAILFTLDQPRVNTKVPCEGERRASVLDPGQYNERTPADVHYSSTLSLRGNMLELSGELTEHNSVTYGGTYTVKEDVTHRRHMKVRLSADKCQVLEFTSTIEVHQLPVPIGRPPVERWSMRATGCSIVP